MKLISELIRRWAAGAPCRPGADQERVLRLEGVSPRWPKEPRAPKRKACRCLQHRALCERLGGNLPENRTRESQYKESTQGFIRNSYCERSRRFLWTWNGKTGERMKF